MKLTRRNFLLFLGVGLAGSQLADLALNSSSYSSAKIQEKFTFSPFKPVKYPIPLAIDRMPPEEQKKQFEKYEVKDDLVLPEGFEYEVIASWGDKVGDSRFGYNNDYVAFIPTEENEGYLVVNFEYISPIPWLQTYEEVIKKPLDMGVLASLKQGEIDVFAMADEQPAKRKFQQFFEELLIDQGIGVISVRKEKGRWKRTYSKQDRRVTGLSGWKDGHYLKATGPAVAVFKKKEGLGYIDGLGEKIIGTFANCAGGTSPWGTVFSAEENFQSQVGEEVMADGTSFPPSSLPVRGTDGQGNPFGLAGNKYGWMVEIDPSNPNDYGTKHTWLGRYRHEAVAIWAEENQPLAVYSGCDRTGGHLYKFVSEKKVVNPRDKANSKLLERGMLYVAKMNPDGTGQWIPLKADTPINPTPIENLVGGLLPIPNPDRRKGGIVNVTRQEELDQFQRQYRRLGDLYVGETEEEIQGAILIDAHFAANVVGGTCTARPEDLELSPIDKSLIIAFTAGSASEDGSPDKTIFSDEEGRVYEYGCLMKIKEKDNQPAALTFTWEIIGAGGFPAMGGMGFANPDNIAFDFEGNLWMVTDMPTGLLNKPDSRYITGAMGNNSIWYIPLTGEKAGLAYPFGIGPMETEICGLCFWQNTLFLAIQHPGERNGIRQDMAAETREFSIPTTDGQQFTQTRLIPKGSNWPAKKPNSPPKPSLVAVYPPAQ